MLHYLHIGVDIYVAVCIVGCVLTWLWSRVFFNRSSTARIHFTPSGTNVPVESALAVMGFIPLYLLNLEASMPLYIAAMALKPLLMVWDVMASRHFHTTLEEYLEVLVISFKTFIGKAEVDEIELLMAYKTKHL